MSKPQQPELRRSERVPALDPDASEAVLSAESTPSNTAPDGPVPEDQQSRHPADDDQDKPDMDAMAERLGVVPEGDEPDDAPSVTEIDDDGPFTMASISKRRRALALAVGIPAILAIVVRDVLRRRRR